MKTYCPPLFAFPAQPIAWSDIRILYSWERAVSDGANLNYICFNDRFCDPWLTSITILEMNNSTTRLTCQVLSQTNFGSYSSSWASEMYRIGWGFRTYCALTIADLEKECPESTHFRCGKKCLSKHRLVDTMIDCVDRSDETYNDSCALNQKHRIRCMPLTNNLYADQCVPEVVGWHTFAAVQCNRIRNLPHFPTLCDGYVEYTVIINGTIETDETNCEEWLCDNQYTRCDGIWNCRNGADEIHCSRALCNNKDAHPCFLWNSSQPICLPISRANDGVIDCMGATDERYLCADQIPQENEMERTRYRCWDQCYSTQINDETVSIVLPSSTIRKKVFFVHMNLCTCFRTTR